MATPAPTPLRTGVITLPTGFKIGPVPVDAITPPQPLPVTSLGPLAAFTGDWMGVGFNTIFRPDSTASPTKLPIPVTGSDNVLELNLTSENLSFSKSLGNVPNRGSAGQPDAFLNGVPYLQAINDVTNPKAVTGIHLEPGLWIIVPKTLDPSEGVTVARMASIPHGTTVQAQGTSTTFNGAPTIPAVDITPFFTTTGKQVVPKFASQTATNNSTPRIPQDLTSFITAGTINQAILDDPNTVIRNAIKGQTIKSTTQISISTSPKNPLFGGGTDNIAFLLGDKAAAKPNAQTLLLTATFWIETVEHTILVPVFKLGDPPLTLHPEVTVPGVPTVSFTVHPPIAIPTPRRITVTSTQIQYSQTVMLNFNTLTWPHVSVATLVPADALTVPSTVWG
jgi:hypothetical protein